jgi:hypothetical protein
MLKKPGTVIEAVDAVLATMHGKERVISPLMQAALGLRVEVPTSLDTDRFGSFSRDIARIGSPLDAARAKIAAAFDLVPQASLGLASEGSFGPHPQIPFLPFDHEIVVLLDRRNGLEIVGHHATPRTNFAHVLSYNVHEAICFAERVGFPMHGLIVMGTTDGQPAPERLLRKDVQTLEHLRCAVEEAIAVCGAAHVATDMRAHRNPTRLRAIKRATLDLLRKFRSTCPRCERPGFIVTERLHGLPCAACAASTNVVRGEVMICAGCAYRLERPAGETFADPARCDFCNP